MSRQAFWSPLLLILLWASLFISRHFFADIPPRNDDALYMMLAKSVSQGGGYQNLALKEDPAGMNLPCVFPLFLAPYWLLLHPHLFLLKMVLALSVALGAWAAYLWLKSFLRWWEALLIALSFACQHMFVMIGNSILTENIFIPLLYFGLYYLSKFRPETKREGPLWAAALFFVLLAKTRVVGIPFLTLFLLWLSPHKRWRLTAAATAAFALLVFIERIFLFNYQTGYGYAAGVAQFSGADVSLPFAIKTMTARYYDNLTAFSGSMFAQIVFPFFYELHPMNWFKRILVVSLFVSSSFGIWRFRKIGGPFSSWLLGAIFLSWLPVFSWTPVGTIYRYLCPFFPFLLLFCYLPLRHLHSHKGIFKNIPALFLALILVNQTVYTLQQKEYDPWVRERENFAAIHDFLAASGEKPELVLSPEPYYTHLKSGLPSMLYRGTKDETNVRPLVERRKVWIIFGPQSTPNLMDSPPLCQKGRWVVYARH